MSTFLFANTLWLILQYVKLNIYSIYYKFLCYSRISSVCLSKMDYKSKEIIRSSLYDRVKKLLVSYEWSDCSFSISGKDFKAHKLILGISSPVFEAMFYGPLSNSNNVIITDIEPDTFQLLLNYIYTDKVELTSIEEAFELLYASRKYLLEQLSDMCITYIQKNVSIDNVTTILNYPEFMQDKELISTALKLFCEHATYLLEHKMEIISPSCMKTVLKSNQMNIKEKDLIKYVFEWTTLYCQQTSTPIDKRHDLLTNCGLFKLLRFFTLSLDELDEITSDVNNILSTQESICIKEVITGSKAIDEFIESSLGSTTTPRMPLKLQWHHCHRSPLRSVAPIIIDLNNYTVHSRIRTNKSIFVTSLCIPTQMAPVFNFRNDAVKTYSEQISVSIMEESDEKVIKFTNFMNTVEYDSMVDIELSEPYFIKKDIWHKISFVWPGNRHLTYSYVVEYKHRYYEDHRVTIEFEDLFVLPGSSGSFLSGLKYCL